MIFEGRTVEARNPIFFFLRFKYILGRVVEKNSCKQTGVGSVLSEFVVELHPEEVLGRALGGVVDDVLVVEEAALDPLGRLSLTGGHGHPVQLLVALL